MRLRRFEDHLHEMLRDPKFAVAYVQTALEDDGIEEFLYAVREVAIAQGGVQKVASESRHGRESLYKSLSKQGNPRIKTLDAILHTLGMRLIVTRVEAAPVVQREQPDTAIPA